MLLSLLSCFKILIINYKFSVQESELYLKRLIKSYHYHLQVFMFPCILTIEFNCKFSSLHVCWSVDNGLCTSFQDYPNGHKDLKNCNLHFYYFIKQVAPFMNSQNWGRCYTILTKSQSKLQILSWCGIVQAAKYTT